MKILGIIIVLTLVTGLGILAPAAAVEGVSVSINNVPGEATEGVDFTASIGITEVVEMNAVQYDISFDPSVLRLDDITTGKIGSTDIAVMFNEIEGGRFRVVQSMGVGTVSGSGYLAVLHFHIIGSLGQRSPINLVNGLIININEAKIPATWGGSSVHVISAESGSQVLPSVAVSPPESATTEPEVGNKEELPPKTSLSPESATTEPEVENKEELPPKISLSPESATTATPNVASGPKPPPPSPQAQSEPINWPALWGVVGGVVVVIGLFILFQLRRRWY